MDNRSIELGISLNNSCNFSCRMCRIWTLDERENRLNREKCYQLIDDLSEFNVKGVRLSGGDPLLMPWALDVARYIHEKGYSSVATTNGSMITESFAERIIDSGLSNLNLSLDGYTSEVHDSARGAPGSYQKIIKAIEHLASRSNGLQIGINTVISNLNLHEIIPLTEMIQADSRVDHIYFMAVMQPFGTRSDRQWFQKDEFRFLWPENPGQIKKVFDRLIKFKEAGYKINNSTAQLRAFYNYFNDPLHSPKKNKCNLGKEALEVNQLGDVYLCYEHEKIGNVFDQRLCHIWQSEKAFDVRSKISNCRQNCNLLINCYFEDEDAQA